MSYRVFGKGAEGASNFAIAKAIDRAVAAGCDLINMSLGGGDPDEATQAAISHARQNGTLVIAAAGNDDRSPVSFPGREALCIAVSALGRKGTYPTGAEAGSAVAPPTGKVDKKEFIAGFSNVGPEIDLTAPGVGIVSTVPGGYAAMDGTSMASPAATGFAAALLAGLPAVLGMPRDENRSDAIAKALLTAAQTRQFPAELEGKGLPLP
jgi:subtilisin